MSVLNNLGMPDLPIRAFQPDAFGNLQLHGGGKGDAPETPDYVGAARETAKGNLEAAKYAAQANRVNQQTPWGTLTWSNDRTFDQEGYDRAVKAYEAQLAQQSQQKNPFGSFGKGTMTAPNPEDFYRGGDQWTQTIELSPEEQAKLDQQNKLALGMFGSQDAALGRLQESMAQGFDMSSLTAGGTPLDPSGLPEAGNIYDPNLDTNNATELLMQRINPELDRRYEMLRGQLANQGIAQGSEAYDREMSRFDQGRNDAATQAALQGIGLGMQQQGQQFGQQTTNRQLAAALQGQQFGQSEAARQRDFAEQSYLRNLPLQELAALSGGTQVQMPQFPGFAQQATTGGPDILGATQAGYQADLGSYNAQQAAGGNLMGGLFGLGGALLGAPSSSILGGLFGL